MRVIVAMTVLVLLNAASAVPALAGETVQVRIRDLGFSPAAISVHAGDIVEWINDDFIDHTATARQGDWDILVPACKVARSQMTKIGDFEYFCRFHPNMTGTIGVTAE